MYKIHYLSKICLSDNFAAVKVQVHQAFQSTVIISNKYTGAGCYFILEAVDYLMFVPLTALPLNQIVYDVTAKRWM